MQTFGDKWRRSELMSATKDKIFPIKEEKFCGTKKVRSITGRLVDQTDEGITLPDIDDLASWLRFSLRDGRIWLDTQRVTLIHLSTLSTLRQELMASLGVIEARAFLTRMGYASGARDAQLARKLRPHHSAEDAFLVGPQLRILQGVSAMKPIGLKIDKASGQFYCEFIWSESFEVDAHISNYGTSNAPVCWMQTGYASGYASSFTGQTIIFKEVECSGHGGDRCHVIGKPLDEWDDIDDDMCAWQPEVLGKRLSSQRAIRVVSETPSKTDHDAVHWDKMIGVSSGFVSACQMLKKVGATSATVLFLGETGVGKEQFARALHCIGPRADKPFVAVNCAAIPENLIESELFGVEKGAFTGAISSRPGRFERANGGTLFLDEVGALTMPAQIKLLRVLQEQEVERVGDTTTRKVDIRMIAATNVNLQEAVKAGNFREDLLFRLNVFPIRIPPLRERRDDIPLLMDHFLRFYSKKYDRPVVGFTDKAVDSLYEYDYPGNIRELENLIERAVILADSGNPVERGHLFINETTSGPKILKLGASGKLNTGEREVTVESSTDLLEQFLSGGTSIKEIESTLLTQAVNKAHGNLAAAARMLGLTRPQLAYRLKKKLHSDVTAPDL
jgi:two-component system, NtrC family, response regulator HydG